MKSPFFSRFVFSLCLIPSVILAFEQSPGAIPEGSAELVTSKTDAAIKLGLSWLARMQQPDGSFGSRTYKGHVATTSLAGLALISSGSPPGRGPYGAQIEKAVRYVVEQTSPAGYIYYPGGSSMGGMYSQGFGTLFLAEAYGMAHSSELHEALSRAVRLIIDTQNNEGGWRYEPKREAEADISVTAAQINALRAARNAGFFVPKETIDASLRYVRQSQNDDGGFRYMRSAGTSAFPRSAAGLIGLYSGGVYQDDATSEDGKRVKKAWEYLENNFPPRFSYTHYFYGLYYFAQALWIRGGSQWDIWYEKVRETLLQNQSDQGQWHDTVCDEYGTAMALIVLQIPNQVLPIFQR
jgi:hypothetical protein